jgi:hypothetical protein
MHGESVWQPWIVVSWEISFLWSTDKVKVSEWCCLKITKNQLVHKDSHSFAFQTTLEYNCIAEFSADFSNIKFCSSYFTRCPCMFLHWGQEFVIKCIKCLSASVYIYIYICILQIENCCQKQSCTSMRYHALAALRYNALSVSCFLSFSVTSNQSHCLWFLQVRRETVPLSGCCHASFSIYLLVT